MLGFAPRALRYKHNIFLLNYTSGNDRHDASIVGTIRVRDVCFMYMQLIAENQMPGIDR